MLSTENIKRGLYIQLTWAIVLAQCNLLPAFSQCSMVMPQTDSAEYLEWMNKNLKFHENWYCSSFNEATIRREKKFSAVIKIRIAPSGLISRLWVVKSSGDPRLDFSCLESLASYAPFEAMPEKRHSYVPNPPQRRSLPEPDNFAEERYAGEIEFGGEHQPKPWPEEMFFLAKHPGLDGYVMHIIPLGINSHYPGLFSLDELNAETNIIVFKDTYLEPDEALQPFLDDWQKFISEHKVASKEDILKEAGVIKAQHQEMLAQY